ncbi:MAG: phenylalanine--tRNA ligase subunit beta [Bacteroidetes bacterium]|nr:MAG: phenylalanine--tRNA ligase subunit beta [Bacteroidota bacterium]PIE88244.1 MAG: phenylalanine--tRNA ligase subunit beta [Bacteroidota bacterium]
MKISYSWLKNYISTHIPAEKMAELLTDCGLEVEKLEKTASVKGGLKGIVIGEVLTCEKHPNADKLSVTTVDIGEEEPLHIVCGAPNVAAGQKVPVATLGTVMYAGEDFFVIKKTKLRGVPSEGMICAEDELGLGSSHEGIMVLDKAIPVGTKAHEYFDIREDEVFEIGLTPNRADATSHIGVARDIKAVLNRQTFEQEDTMPQVLTIPDVSSFRPDNATRPFTIHIKDEKACRRYTGVSLSNVEVKPSPKWMQEYLKAVGIRPVNNLVDIGNFVMMETGQPLHIFDADKIEGDTIEVRMAKEKETFVTLDGEQRTLHKNDLMICDAQKPMCIAGVFGGIHSGVTQETQNIFIESAWFDPSTIRKTARRHTLQTDASFRFERGSDIEMTTYALKRAALLVKELAGGTISSEINDTYPNPLARKTISVNYDRLFSLIGKHFSRTLVKHILESLDMIILQEDDQNLLLEVPTAKVDVTREADIVEEVLRIYGYNHIELSNEIHSALSTTGKPHREKVLNRIANLLSDNGFNEIINNSLTASDYYHKDDFPEETHVKMLNPLSKELNILRRTLLFGGLEVISYNRNRKVSDLKLYEFGKTYHQNPGVDQGADVTQRFTENNRLALFLSGNTTKESWYQPPQEASLFDLKNQLLNLLHKVGISRDSLTELPTEAHWFSEGIDLMIKKRCIASLGKVSTRFLKPFDIQTPVFFATIDYDLLLAQIPQRDHTMTPIPKFPGARRDLALLVDKTVTYREITDIVKQNGGKLIKEVNLFDVYEGDKLEAGKKSYAISLVLQDNDKTLTDKLIDKTIHKLISAFERKIGATIR